MFTDRKELIEFEIKKLQTEAANMYLSIVISGNDIHNAEYQTLKTKLADLQFDLTAINELIKQGHR